MKKTNIAWCIAWIGGVTAANLIVTEMGPEYSILTAFLFIGLSITSRDFLHDAWEWHGLRWKMPALIAVGGAVSYLIQQDAGRIALASVAAFIMSESVDAVVYHSMRKKGYYKRVNGSNAASSAIDSILFPVLAFGGFPVAIMFGQFVAKVAGGAIWSWALRNKKAVGVAAVVAISAHDAGAASVEHHLDSRGYATTTISHFRPGAVEFFGFADIDHNSTNFAYAEASVYFNQFSITPTLQVNGGRSSFFPVDDVVLIGFRIGVIDLLARSDGSVQATYAWRRSIGRFVLMGFADVWTDGKDVWLIAEPSLWFPLTKRLSIGTEVEISKDVSGPGWGVSQTIAVSLNF